MTEKIYLNGKPIDKKTLDLLRKSKPIVYEGWFVDTKKDTHHKFRTNNGNH